MDRYLSAIGLSLITLGLIALASKAAASRAVAAAPPEPARAVQGHNRLLAYMDPGFPAPFSLN
jgi:hypothetical protein